MPSLSQLLTDHGSLLVFDAASTRVQVGLFESNAPAKWRDSTEEAGRSIFICAELVLKESQRSIDGIGALVFCEGPGSMLGVRTVAMALRTWRVLKSRPVFAYQSLAVAGRAEWTLHGARNFSIVADARRDSWHCQAVATDGAMAPLHRVAAVDLPDGEITTPENFRTWSVPPRPFGSCSYDLEKIFAALGEGDFFREVEDPEAFQHEAPEYKKSPARIHSIASSVKDK